MGLDYTQLPSTTGRLVTSITLQVTNPNGGPNIRLGAIKGMDRTMSREVTRRRELDSDPPGGTIELIPGVVGTFELSIERAMLYKSNMLEAFGFTGIEDIISQNKPFDIVETRHDPLSDKTQVVTYTGCYFTSIPQSIDIDNGWVIFQKATIMVANATITGSSTQAPSAGGIDL